MRWGWQTLVVVGALLLPLLQQDVFEWCYWLAERLVRRAARCLPHRHRQRYEEEWLAELGELRGRNISALLWALWVLGYAPSVGRGLRAQPVGPYRLLRNGYIVAVATAGLGLGGWLLAHGGLQATERARGSFLLVLLAAVGVQLRHYRPRPDSPTTFTIGSLDLVLLVGWGMAAGAPAGALASVIGSVAQRRSAVKVLFNGGHYLLCLAAASWVYTMVNELLPETWGQLVAIATAGVSFTTLSALLVRVLLGLHQPKAMSRELREGWIADGLWCLALILAAPVVLLVLQRSPAFLPLLLLPEAVLLVVFRRFPSLGSPPAQQPPASSITT